MAFMTVALDKWSQSEPWELKNRASAANKWVNYIINT